MLHIVNMSTCVIAITFLVKGYIMVKKNIFLILCACCSSYCLYASEIATQCKNHIPFSSKAQDNSKNSKVPHRFLPDDILMLERSRSEHGHVRILIDQLRVPKRIHSFTEQLYILSRLAAEKNKQYPVGYDFAHECFMLKAMSQDMVTGDNSKTLEAINIITALKKSDSFVDEVERTARSVKLIAAQEKAKLLHALQGSPRIDTSFSSKDRQAKCERVIAREN